jgi:hypothetical protein
MSSSGSNSSSSHSSLLSLASAVTVTATLLGALGYTYYTYNTHKCTNVTKKHSKKKKTKYASSKREKQVKPAKSAISSDSLSDAGFCSELQLANQLITEYAVIDDAQINRLLPKLKQLTAEQINNYSLYTRIQAAKFLINYYNVKSLIDSNINQFLQLQPQLYNDMQKAWELLNFPSNPSLQSQTFNSEILTLQLTVASKLQDKFKLNQAFHQLFHTYSVQDLDDEALCTAFNAAPLLGRYKLTLELAQKVFKYHEKSIFHLAVLSRPDIVDCTVLSDCSAQIIAELGEDYADASLELVEWEYYDIGHFTYCFRSVSCADATLQRSYEQKYQREQSLRNASKLSRHDFSGSERKIIRSGCIINSFGLFGTTVPIAGFMRRNKLELRGYVEIHKEKGNQPEKHLKHIEIYCLQRVEGNNQGKDKNLEQWSGVYTVIEENIPAEPGNIEYSSVPSKDGASVQQVTIDYSITIYLRKYPSISL